MRLCRGETYALVCLEIIGTFLIDNTVINRWTAVLGRNDYVHPMSKRGGVDNVAAAAAAAEYKTFERYVFNYDLIRDSLKG